MFDRFFDDAALFPPGDAPMATAVAAHRARRSSLTGPFVVTAARLDEMREHLTPDGPPLDVSLIAAPADLPDAVDRIARITGLRLAAVETPVAADAKTVVRVTADVLPPEIPVAVEIPRTDQRDDVLDALAGTALRAKLRTGGLRAELFPSPDELAATIRACLDRGLAFKCTAGLHHAVRHVDPATGFEHHGFLNVLLAAADPADAPAHLRRTDGPGIASDVRNHARARAAFTSFGTCSVTEPVDDLINLGLLPAHERITA
ncbi:hypothetical protein [Actinoplanes solisilvae]|uniref:hypothetical protein n=1 Tax=Actinoplanes solisilvae TaxID=2486853 RepID=UPI00196A9890|nr:hypothetical protein [Actinoplanes solisilvae]